MRNKPRETRGAVPGAGLAVDDPGAALAEGACLRAGRAELGPAAERPAHSFAAAVAALAVLGLRATIAGGSAQRVLMLGWLNLAPAVVPPRPRERGDEAAVAEWHFRAE